MVHPMPRHMTGAQRILEVLLTRRSVSPRRLQSPGPNPDELDAILQAGLRAPDHGALHPWRVIEFRPHNREALARCFEQEKLRRDPLAAPADLKRAREHATRPPLLLGFVVAPRERSKIPAREQWLSAGAALGNILSAAHQLGYGAIVLSGERCFDETLARQVGVLPGEYLVGFVSMGSIREAPPQARELLSQSVWSCWQGTALQAMPELPDMPELPGPAAQPILPSERMRGN
jgi:nitroreductase